MVVLSKLLLMGLVAGCTALLTACADTEGEYGGNPDWGSEPQPELQPEPQPKEKTKEELDGQEDLGEPVVQGAEVLCSNGKDDKDILQLIGNGNSAVSMVGIEEMTKTDITLSNSNKFQFCKFFNDVCPGAEIEDKIWKNCENLTDNGSDKNVLNYLESFMFCEKGMGIICFEKTGQEMGEFIEEAYTCQFVGYLAYGAEEIVTDSNGGFFKLYNAPTFKNSQEQKYFMDIYEKYGVEPYGAIQSFGKIAGVNKSGDIKYGGQEKDPKKGTLVYNGLERYVIALAPRLQNPNVELKPNIDPNEMIYGTCVDISIVLDGETYYIPAIIGDIKEHSAPEGIFQTGVPFDGGGTVDTGEKGVIVEWYVDAGEGEKNKSTGLKNFNTNGSIIYYYDEVLK